MMAVFILQATVVVAAAFAMTLATAKQAQDLRSLKRQPAMAKKSLR